MKKGKPFFKKVFFRNFKVSFFKREIKILKKAKKNSFLLHLLLKYLTLKESLNRQENHLFVLLIQEN